LACARHQWRRVSRRAGRRLGRVLAFGGGVLTVLGALALFLFVLGTPAGAAFWWFHRRRAVSAE
jgi:hypothetical protein